MERYRHSGDALTATAIFQRYSDLIYGVCLKYLKDPEEASDALMDIYGELMEKLKRHEIGNVKGWLYTLTKNHCLMKLRRSKHFKATEFPEQFMHSEEEAHLNGMMEKEENLQRLESCLKELPDEQKRAVELFYLKNKCYKEIEELTGMDWNSVRSYLQNGRRNLKLCMERPAIRSDSRGS